MIRTLQILPLICGGVVQNGKPMQFKSRRKVTKQESLKTWKQLLSSNWVEFDFEMNKSV